MIKFKSISWRNFLSTGDSPTTINLDKSPTTLIIGENGSGKSTILDGLTFGLFGKPFRNINKPQLVNAINERGLLVEIEFTIGKKNYIVRRGIKPNIFEIVLNGKLLDQTANVRDYQDYLEKIILKLNYKSFTQIVLLGSSTFEPFMQLKLSDRRAIVEDLLDIQIFSFMNTILKQRGSELKSDMGTLEVEKGLYNHKIKIQNDYVERLKQNNESDIKYKEDTIIDFESDKATARTVSTTLHNEVQELNNQMLFEDSIKNKNYEYNNLQNKIEIKLKQEQKELQFYEKNSTCPSCKQVIDDMFKKERIIDISEGVADKQGGIEKILLEIDGLEQKLAEFQIISRGIADRSNKLAGVESSIQSLDLNIERARIEINALKEKKELDNSVLEELQELKDLLEESQKDYSELCNTKQVYNYAHELLKDSGIKTKIIRQYVPIINKYVNKYLNELEFLINFTIDESFNETIQSQYRDEFTYSSFSEGEKMRIDLALLFTWRKIAKLKNSVNTNLLILDEVFDSSLDAEGTDAFLKIINTLDADTNVFVISHKGEILYDKFMSTIKFVKEKNFSKIEAG